MKRLKKMRKNRDSTLRVLTCAVVADLRTILRTFFRDDMYVYTNKNSTNGKLVTIRNLEKEGLLI